MSEVSKISFRWLQLVLNFSLCFQGGRAKGSREGDALRKSRTCYREQVWKASPNPSARAWCNRTRALGCQPNGPPRLRRRLSSRALIATRPGFGCWRHASPALPPMKQPVRKSHGTLPTIFMSDSLHLIFERMTYSHSDEAFNEHALGFQEANLNGLIHL